MSKKMLNPLTLDQFWQAGWSRQFVGDMIGNNYIKKESPKRVLITYLQAGKVNVSLYGTVAPPFLHIVYLVHINIDSI